MARPTGYERDDVVDKAMHAFWERGYRATGMSELVGVTGLNPGSLYGAFESKQGLLLAALDHYGQRSATRIEQTLAKAATPLAGVRQFFRDLGRTLGGPDAARGCFLVNTVLEIARGDEAVRASVNAHFDRIEALFAAALDRARAAGELAADTDPKALAAFLMTTIWGLRVLGGTLPGARRVKAVIGQVLAILDGAAAK